MYDIIKDRTITLSKLESTDKITPNKNGGVINAYQLEILSGTIEDLKTLTLFINIPNNKGAFDYQEFDMNKLLKSDLLPLILYNNSGNEPKDKFNFRIHNGLDIAIGVVGNNNLKAISDIKFSITYY